MGYDRGDSFPFDFLNQMGIHLVQNREKSCHHDHIPFNLKGNGILVLSVQTYVLAVRETGVSRGNHVCQIEDTSSETP